MTIMDNYFIHNRETGKLELHFDKATYDALTAAQKAEIRGAFLWGRNSGCWISRAKEPHLSRPTRIAESIGLTDAGQEGERRSFAEQMEIKAERAERRAERFEHRAGRLAERGQQLQKPLNDMRGDTSFFTQPNINTSSGRAFTRRRQRMFDACNKGFELLRESDYWKERAAKASRAADQPQLKDKAFVGRRINDCESRIRKLQKSIEESEARLKRIEAGESVKNWKGEEMSASIFERSIEADLDTLEAELDKLAFYQERMDELGGVQFSRDNIKPGYVVNVKHYKNQVVVSTGPKNFTYKSPGSAIVLTASYAEIMKVVEAREAPVETHPFMVGERYTGTRWNGETRRFEPLVYEIIKATEKTVTLKAEGVKPFTRKPVKKSWSDLNEWYIKINDNIDGVWCKQK